ncbi:MAG: CapA family protein [Dehalococcoidia bacterium]
MRIGRRAFLQSTLAALTGAAVACASDASGDVRIERRATSSVVAASPGATAVPTAAVDPAIRIGAVGDLMFARDITTLMLQHGAGYPFERVRPLFEGLDFLVGNMEGTFTTRGSALTKTYTFRTPPELATGLTAAGFDLVALANNHAFDFGSVSLEDTLAALQRAGVVSVGAGTTEAAARAGYVAEVRGKRVAALSYSGVDESGFATPGGPGVARATVEAVREDVQRLAPLADYVLVFMHAGVEYTRAPSDLQRAIAYAAIESGADVVIGSHPHVLQGWERHHDGLILYSLGNFVFDLDTDDLSNFGGPPFETAVAVLTLRPDAPPAVEFRPAYIDPIEDRPRPATSDETARVMAALREIPR